MGEAETSLQEHPREKLLFNILFCVAAIAVNFAGSQLVTLFNVPLYFDAFGTLIAAMLGGYVPGVIVGYITNILTATSDPSSVYYGVLNVLIGLSAAYFMQHGWFKRIPTAIIAITAFAVIGGVLGSLITWLLYGLDGGSSLAAPIVAALSGIGVPALSAQVFADFCVDFVDKAIIVIIALILYRIIPAKTRDAFDFTLWQQKPLNKDERTAVANTKPRIVSLLAKIVAPLSIIMVVITLVAAGISFATYHGSNISVQSEYGVSIADMAKTSIDGDRVQEYLEKGQKAPGYAETKANLQSIKDSFPAIEYLYAYQILEDGCHVVFDLDTEDTPGSSPGEVVDFDEAFADDLPALLKGEPIDPIVTNETYGWLLTVYEPVHDSAGKTVCYACVDIAMDELVAQEFSFLTKIITLFAAFFIVVCVIAVWLANFSIVIPISSIALASSGFAFGKSLSRKERVERIHGLNIRTGDEIENLFQALDKTTADMMRYIEDVSEKSATIDRMQSNLIMVMADLVESRDKFTGNHIRNTAAYVEVILHQMREDGVYADQLTDEFISNTIRSAPLHDIGKIAVSDAILNKPGRLTEEEYKIMQGHTIAGRDILRSAVGAVSDASYLDEAQNLAACHHEKWNGTGYPFGLAGEDIPLSARVMAVADVFDALASKRSYKDPMPIDKVFAIIRKDAGSHFDPVVAESFFHAEAEIRRIAAENADENPSGLKPLSLDA